MKTVTFVGCAILSACLSLFGIEAANAQATRTWVSGVGDDVNPCSRTAPCKTFAGAISKTAAGGEISVLDPGGFGAVTITKAITIDGGGGPVASILASGVNGVIINAGVNDFITLRNLSINGAGVTLGLNGVRFLAGAKLQIENCFIFGFSQNGVDVVPTGGGKVVIQDSSFNNNGNGIQLKSGGGSIVRASLMRVNASDNSSAGIRIDGSGGAGTVNVSVTDTIASNNGTDGLSAASGAAGAVVAVVSRSVFSGNAANGIQSNQTAGSSSFVSVGASTLMGNQQAALATGGGTLSSYGTNFANGNFAVNGTFSGPQAQQ